MPQEKVSKTKTSIWAIKCPYCSTTFQDLRVHLVTDKVSPSTKSSSRVNCNYCDLVISNPTCMKRHEEKVHGGLYSGISCQECNIAFYDYNDLKTHKNLCHNAGVEANVERYQHESELKNDNLDEDFTYEEEASDVAEAADETSSQFHENLTSSTLPDGADSQGSSQGLDNEVKEEENLKITVNEDDNRNPTSSVVKSWGKPWGWVTSEGTPQFPNAQICDVCQKVFNKRDTKKYFLEHLKKCQKFYQFAIEGEMCSFCHKNDFLSYGRLLGHIETEHQEDIKKDNFRENINEINVSPGSSPDRDEQMKNLSQQDSMEEKSSSIEYKCRFCDKIFSSARESLDHSIEVCKYCKKCGHSLNNCPTLSNRKCQKCHKLGHSDMYCREKNSFNSNMIFGEQNSQSIWRYPDSSPKDNSEVCKYCKNSGHSIIYCQKLAYRKCQKCNKFGHLYIYCKEKNSFTFNAGFVRPNSQFNW